MKRTLAYTREEGFPFHEAWAFAYSRLRCEDEAELDRWLALMRRYERAFAAEWAAGDVGMLLVALARIERQERQEA